MKYNALFFSDIHLGSRYSNCSKLLEFIKNNEFSEIYMIGDIIDILAIKRKISWSESENTFIQKILRLARKGVKIYYIIGNHDQEMNMFAGDSFGNISIVNEIVRKYGENTMLVIHGDIFDVVLRSMTIFYDLGDKLYEYLLSFNRLHRFIVNSLKIKTNWSPSFFLKHNVKNVLKYLNSYEKLMTEEAKFNKCETVICGHSHFAEQKKIGNINYINCGCWTMDCGGSFVLEHLDGKLELIKVL